MAGYDVWSKVALGLGYRYLFVNYDSDRFLFDTKTKGLVLGASIHW
jgi:opacity protein-like surface antigen